MRKIVRNIKYNMDIIKPSAKILLILLFILTFLLIFGSSIYGSISRNSIILMVFNYKFIFNR